MNEEGLIVVKQQVQSVFLCRCPHCHTLNDVSLNEVGDKIVCDDCLYPFIVGTCDENSTI
jgi:hypothetical protein